MKRGGLSRAGWGTLILHGLLAACGPTIILEERTSPAPAADADSPRAKDDVEATREAVREAVRTYGAALATQDGVAATALVVDDTFIFYERLRLASLLAEREELERWDLLRVVMVLQLRVALKRPELEALDGRSLFIHAVGAGLVGGGIEGVPLDEVWLDETQRQAEVRVDGETVVSLGLETRVGGQGGESWRVDVPEIVLQVGPALEEAARARIEDSGKVRTALFFVELSTEDFVDIAVLDGPLEPEPTPDPVEVREANSTGE